MPSFFMTIKAIKHWRTGLIMLFFSMRAVLALDEIDSKKHSGIISEFQKNYIKTKIFDTEMSVIIKKLFQARANSDYDDFYVISIEDTEKQFHDAEKFVATIEKFLKEKYCSEK